MLQCVLLCGGELSWACFSCTACLCAVLGILCKHTLFLRMQMADARSKLQSMQGVMSLCFRQAAYLCNDALQWLSSSSNHHQL